MRVKKGAFHPQGRGWLLHSAQERVGVFSFYQEFFQTLDAAFPQELSDLNLEFHIGSRIRSLDYE